MEVKESLQYHRKYFIPCKCCNCGKMYFVPSTSRNPQPKGLYPVRHKTSFTCSKECSQKVHRMNPRLRKEIKKNYKIMTWEEHDI